MRIARRVHRFAAILAAALRNAGATVGGDHFDTLHVSGIDAAAAHAKARAARVNLRPLDAGSLALSLDETTTREDVVQLATLFGARIDDIDALDAATPDALPAALRRASAFLAHPVFNTHHSEHELLRYMRPPNDLPPANNGRRGHCRAASATAARTVAWATLGVSGRLEPRSMYGNW